jgi:hypothetical protein
MCPSGVWDQLTLRAQATCDDIFKGGSSSVQSNVGIFEREVGFESTAPSAWLGAERCGISICDADTTTHPLVRSTLDQL